MTKEDPDRRLFQEARDFRDKGEHVAAIAVLTDLIGRRADLAGLCLIVRGSIFEEDTDEPTKALQDFMRAVDLLPESRLASTSLFYSLLSFGRIQEAIKETDRFCLTLTPERRKKPLILDYLRLRAKYKACTPEDLEGIRQHFWVHRNQD